MSAEVQPVTNSPGLFRVVVVCAGIKLRSRGLASRGQAADLAWVAERELAKHYTEFFKKWERVDLVPELATDGA